MPGFENELENYSKLSFEKVALRQLLIKDLLPIVSMSRQPGGKPHVSGCFIDLGCLVVLILKGYSAFYSKRSNCQHKHKGFVLLCRQ